MSSDNDSADILGELLGGQRSPIAQAPSRTTAAAEWEYREVIFRDYRGWRAQAVNGVALGDWKTAATIVEYLEQAGNEGWELVSMGERHNNHKEAYFKRPKR